MIDVTEAIPGKAAAHRVQDRIRELGIQDVQLFFDNQIRMWAVCQVRQRTTSLTLLSDIYNTPIEPYIMWWVKNQHGAYREPSEQDVNDVVATVERAHKIWAKGGDWLADRLDDQDLRQHAMHVQRQRERIHAVAPALKRAIRRELA